MKRLSFLLAFLLLFSSCSQEHKEETNIEAEKSSPAETVNAKADITVSGAWVRPAAKDRNTGIFLTIMNNSDTPDTLTGAQSDAAEKTEVHETFKQGDDMLGMREVENIPIQPHGTLELKPMHHHIMLIKLNSDIRPGDTTKVVLHFSRYGNVSVNAVAMEQTSAHHEHSMHE